MTAEARAGIGVLEMAGIRLEVLPSLVKALSASSSLLAEEGKLRWVRGPVIQLAGRVDFEVNFCFFKQDDQPVRFSTLRIIIGSI